MPSVSGRESPAPENSGVPPFFFALSQPFFTDVRHLSA
ncbi:hypothetical protein BAMY6639_00040 [Bacillus amyloliquefaciens UMAF6639]|nr:hypothetical protein BAMY6639_00040 [Bacillus amyloliquefaciens UMAF6639]